jgi:hypothetical protein
MMEQSSIVPYGPHEQQRAVSRRAPCRRQRRSEEWFQGGPEPAPRGHARTFRLSCYTFMVLDCVPI